jgi:three-Cys-motif partner protein
MTSRKDKEQWGGQWTEEKLQAFEKYVKAYLTIMNQYRDAYRVKWRLIYFDAFAGSGVRKNEKPSELQQRLAGFDIEPDECALYKGAAERVLALKTRGFDYYYFVDKDDSASENLCKRLLGDNTDDPRLQFRIGDANDYITKLGNHLQKDKYCKALVLLDPFGMQVNWESLTHLQGTGTDLWILVPSGVIIGRLLKNDGTLKNPALLEKYFGLSEKEIHSRFYAEKAESTLFGNEIKQSKLERPTQRIADTYVERLSGLFKHVAASKPLRNSRGVPIYHFIFASNNAVALKIAKYIIGKD